MSTKCKFSISSDNNFTENIMLCQKNSKPRLAMRTIISNFTRCVHYNCYVKHSIGWLVFNVHFQHKYGYIRDEARLGVRQCHTKLYKFEFWQRLKFRPTVQHQGYIHLLICWRRRLVGWLEFNGLFNTLLRSYSAFIQIYTCDDIWHFWHWHLTCDACNYYAWHQTSSLTNAGLMLPASAFSSFTTYRHADLMILTSESDL